MKPRVLLADLGREWRGGQKQTLLLANNLYERGWECSLLVRDGSRFADLAGVDVHEVRSINDLDPRTFAAAGRLIRRLRPTIVHASESRSHSVLALSAAGTPMIVTRRILRPPTLNRKYQKPQHYLAVSGAVADVLAAAGIPRTRITVVAPAVVVPEWTRPVEESGSILTLAAVEEDKGALDAGQVAAKVAPLTWNWAGVDKDPDSRSGWPGNLCYCNELDDVGGVLHGAAVYASLSHSEGFGTAILEALAYGLPVVTTDTGAARALIGPETGSIRAIGDLDGIATDVVSWMGDVDRRRRASVAGPEVAAQYRVDLMVRETVRCYEKALGDTGASGIEPGKR